MTVTRTRERPGAARRAWTAGIAVLLAVGSAATAMADDELARLDDLEVFAIDHGEPARIVVSAPAELATRTLTDDDVEVDVDGRPRTARVQRLPANDLEVAVVVDTTVGAANLRSMQGAVVELALTLPQGARMHLIDAEGTVSAAAPVPGPAIAAVRQLRAGTDDDIATAVERARTVLDDSARARTALVAVGGDLGRRLEPLDDRPLRSLSYMIDVGGRAAEGQTDLLGPRAAGEVLRPSTFADVPAATDDIADDLGSLYLVEVPVGDPGARTVTVAAVTAEGATPATTFALDPDRLRPTPAGSDADAPGTSDQRDQAPPGAAEEPRPVDPGAGGERQARTTGWAPWALLAAVALIATVLWRAWSRPQAAGPALPAHSTHPTPAPPAAQAPAEPAPPPPVEPAPPPPVEPAQAAHPLQPRQRRPGEKAPRPQRPIAKLAPGTRQALARAHLGLRRLALASRETAGMVPDDLFRLTEACASAALGGHDRTLDAVLLSMLSEAGERTDDDVVQRAATALSTGWRHTARQRSAPPPVVEINALLRGSAAYDRERRRRPVTPVRALNPLVEIGIDHMVLAAQPDEHAGLIARAVTAVDLMRAARLAHPVLTLSPHLLTDVERYRAACRADPTDAAARDDWLQFLCDAIARRSAVSIEQLNRLRRLRARYRDAAPDPLSARLADLLLARPVINARLIARHLAVPSEQASAVVAAAHRVGWLRPRSDDEDASVATEVMEVVAPALVDPAARQPA